LPSSSTASSLASGSDSSTNSFETAAEHTQDTAIATVEQGEHENRYSRDSRTAPVFRRFVDPTNKLPASVHLGAIDLAHTQVAPDQSTNIQSATDPSIRVMSTDSSGGTSPRPSSRASTPPGSKRSSEEFQEDEEGQTHSTDSNKRARCSSQKVVMQSEVLATLPNPRYRYGAEFYSVNLL